MLFFRLVLFLTLVLIDSVLVPAVFRGHDDSEYDGNPEFFFSPDWEIRGPRWKEKEYIYDNSQPAAANWYHGMFEACT